MSPVCVENYPKYCIEHITNIFKIFDYLFVILFNLSYLNIINNFIEKHVNLLFYFWTSCGASIFWEILCHCFNLKNTVVYFHLEFRYTYGQGWRVCYFMNEWLILLKSFNYPSTLDVDFNYKLTFIKPSSVFYRKYIPWNTGGREPMKVVGQRYFYNFGERCFSLGFLLSLAYLIKYRSYRTRPGITCSLHISNSALQNWSTSKRLRA